MRAVKIDRAEVRRIAALAHLEFDDGECDALARQLNDILAYVEKLEELDTSAVTPTSHVLEAGEALRDDEERPGLQEAEALANAPEKGVGHFKVPKVLG